jgi:hypothetical protein
VVTHRTIALDDDTDVARVSRAKGAGPHGWIHGFREEPVTRGALAVGDFVTVTTEREGERLQALALRVLHVRGVATHGDAPAASDVGCDYLGFGAKSRHHPFGLIFPSTSLQESGGTKCRHRSHCWSAFGLS